MTTHFGNIACNARQTATQMAFDCWSQQYAGFDVVRYIGARAIWQVVAYDNITVTKYNVDGDNMSRDYGLGKALTLDAIDEHEISQGGLV
jgi:hypothetical protein